MSLLATRLSAENVRCRSAASSRKRVLQEIAQTLACASVSADELFDGLMARERLGSTGLGEGVAIPHCRADVAQITLAVVSTDAPIDYEAPDQSDVDLFFALVVPTDEHNAHLGALAELSEMLSDQGNRQHLRGCKDNQELVVSIKRLLGKT